MHAPAVAQAEVRVRGRWKASEWWEGSAPIGVSELPGTRTCGPAVRIRQGLVQVGRVGRASECMTIGADHLAHRFETPRGTHQECSAERRRVQNAVCVLRPNDTVDDVAYRTNHLNGCEAGRAAGTWDAGLAS
eukprot:scaffold1309_cov117-Isochrysis_galbana.AAC.17